MHAQLQSVTDCDTDSHLSAAAAKIEQQIVNQIESVTTEFPPINRKLGDRES
jgi:hypothetical protein